MTLAKPLWLVLPLMLLATGAAAQTSSADNPWSAGTTLGLFAGGAVSESDGGVALGGTIGWEVLPWFAVEGRAGWDTGMGDIDAFSGSLAARLGMARPRPVVPFVKLGVGLYRASFDTPTRVPSFYRRRMGNRFHTGSRHTFTDPTIVAGGGINIFTSRHLAIRPEIDATFVMGDSRVRTVTSFSVHFAYHFEDHPVTPARRR